VNRPHGNAAKEKARGLVPRAFVYYFARRGKSLIARCADFPDGPKSLGPLFGLWAQSAFAFPHDAQSILSGAPQLTAQRILPSTAKTFCAGTAAPAAGVPI